MHTDRYQNALDGRCPRFYRVVVVNLLPMCTLAPFAPTNEPPVHLADDFQVGKPYGAHAVPRVSPLLRHSAPERHLPRRSRRHSGFNAERCRDGAKMDSDGNRAPTRPLSYRTGEQP